MSWLKYMIFVGFISTAMGVWGTEPVIMVYSAAMPYLTLTVDLLSADLEIVFDNKPELRVELRGSGAPEFKHSIVYSAKTAGLTITEDWAIGQRVGTLLESSEEERPATGTTMTVRLPASMENSVIVLKSKWGSVNVVGAGHVLQQSLSAESLHGPISIEKLRGLRAVLKTANGAITLKESFFQFFSAQTINGAITLQLKEPSKGGIRLSVAQVAGGVYVNDQKMRASPFMRSFGRVLEGAGGSDAELELRTGYGAIRIVF
jgi:hypothetical protein